jgi:hypothetical protein
MNETDILYSIADAEITSDKEAYAIWNKYRDTTPYFKLRVSYMVESIRVRESLWQASTSEVTKRIINDWKEKE